MIKQPYSSGKAWTVLSILTLCSIWLFFFSIAPGGRAFADEAYSAGGTVPPTAVAPNMTLVKRASLVVDADGDGVPSPGDTLVYSLSIRNIGNRPALGLVLTDSPDPNTSLVVGSVNASQGQVTRGNGVNDAVVEIALGRMAGGAVATVTFQAVIHDPLPVGVQSVSNQATLAGTNIDAILSDDPTTAAMGDATQITVTATPVLLVTKRDFLFQDADGDSEVGPGDTLLYTVRIVNTGNTAATDVRFTDMPDPQTVLEANSVMVIPSGREIIAGNNSGDVHVEIHIGTILPNGVVNIGFRVKVLPDAVDRIVNQATVEYVNPNEIGAGVNTIRSDNPNTAIPNDPTITPIRGGESVGGPLLLPLIYAGGPE